MDRNKALFLTSQESQTSFHHRGKHLAHYLAKRFGELHVVSNAKLHDGPGSDPIWKKVLYGLRDLILSPVEF